MTGHASRATVDFDAFERELRQTSQEAAQAKAPAAAPKDKSRRAAFQTYRPGRMPGLRDHSGADP